MSDGARLKIVQVGEQVLRGRARNLSPEEIRGEPIQQLIAMMRDTMRDAPGVGLAAPQIGLGLRLAVIEDAPEYVSSLPENIRIERERSPVPFHAIANPELSIIGTETADFFEGCLSLSGFVAAVPRARRVNVKCLNESGEEVEIDAQGWYARILQHEIDHLNGYVYIDRMYTRSFMTSEHYSRYWGGMPVKQALLALGGRPD
ncbi:MAG TPA: peptide deformylase [Blastocatellia bacterium]|nr:peptide deformylase [Blastocatellia bacterium]